MTAKSVVGFFLPFPYSFLVAEAGETEEQSGSGTAPNWIHRKVCGIVQR
jgi:hypothetical protein